MQSIGLRESYTMDPTTPLDREGRGPVERILREFLPNVWWELRDQEERGHHTEDMIVSAGKRLEEVIVVQTAKKYLESSVMITISEARQRVKEESQALLERHRSEGMERVEETATGLLVDLDATKYERDEVVDDVEATLLAKRDLEHVLTKTTAEVTSLQMLQIEAETSFRRLSEQGEHARGETVEALGKVLELSTELKAVKAEVALLHEQVVGPIVGEVESLAELEAAKAEVALLHEQVANHGAREVELLFELKAS
ncbi:hypothetical protein ACLOJK_034173 [Asimina triloba]